MTTRIAVTFSWTLAFRSSYLRNTWRKIFRVTAMIEPMTITRNTTAIRNMPLKCRLMMRHMVKLKIRFSGARTATRITIMKAFCTLVISVVIRVTRPGTLNLSIFENEKVWMLA